MSAFNLKNGNWQQAINLTAVESSNLVTHLLNHRKCTQDVSIFISGSSGIGTNVVAICGCDEKSQYDITDYDSW